jgi:eukaryotic-like serine/threonine-protein kinase
MGVREIEKALFEAASLIDDPLVRSQFLDQACEGAAQRRRLANLLDAHELSGQFFSQAVEARSVVAAEAHESRSSFQMDEDAVNHRDALDIEGPGTWIGRYKVLERIGEGGCGIVYLAEQQEPVQRLVALKVIRLGMDTENVVARFEMERQALAVMDHPNIAHVLDAGATDRGRPYFVMEWVRGVKITDYCNDSRLDVHQRINLFIKVCNAIQHAHQKGVIHRDIKPSNILVTLHNDQPEPKVIDFGIAKATSGKSVGATVFTANEHFLGTPAYMSPEQANQNGMDVDTRSDVYGLGILLYELLAGRTPFDPKELSALGVIEMRRTLIEVEPPPPSAMLASIGKMELAAWAAHCHAEPAKLVSMVRGDLDWVVMKAIDKARQRRYETVNALAMDLKRFSENEPVVARPPRRCYLLTKFVRRNRLAVASAAAIASALVMGGSLAYVSYLREREARQDQVKLRQIAEASLANEERLRAMASVRENIAQVAVMMSEGNIEEADAQLRQTPLSTIEPSLEAANVLRSLGGWNAMRGRWQEASECFSLLIQANHLTSMEQIVVNRDLITPAPALVESGDRQAYQKFRDWAVERFRSTTDPMAAEQVIKATLSLPASPELLERLMPLKEVIEKSQLDRKRLKSPHEVHFAVWRAWAVCLLEYRRGNFEQSLVWGWVALEYNDPSPAVSALVHTVLAMAHHRLGHNESALADLDKSRTLINRAFDPELDPAYEPLGKAQGFWWDWVNCRILFREAEAMIELSLQEGNGFR